MLFRMYCKDASPSCHLRWRICTSNPNRNFPEFACSSRLLLLPHQNWVFISKLNSVELEGKRRKSNKRSSCRNYIWLIVKKKQKRDILKFHQGWFWRWQWPTFMSTTKKETKFVRRQIMMACIVSCLENQTRCEQWIALQQQQLQKRQQPKLQVMPTFLAGFRRRRGVNFINILQAAFTPADPKSAKKTVKSSSFFALLGSVSV